MMEEEKVEIELNKWLRIHGRNIVEIYFNRKNKIDAPIFKIKAQKGYYKKPDIIISYIDFFKKLSYCCVEVKDGTIAKNVFDSSKIFSIYYKNYLEGKTKYFINDKEINISDFVVTTQFSKFGKLIEKDTQIIDNANSSENDIWREMSVKNKTLPRCEYQRTRDFLRHIWADFRKYREKNKLKFAPSLGIIESNILMKFSPEELKFQSGMIGKPIISTMGYKTWGKNQWQQKIINL